MTGLRTMSGKPYRSPDLDNGRVYVATNLVENPRFESVSSEIQVRKNLTPNPDFELDTHAWASYGGPGSIVISDEWSRTGTYSCKAIGGSSGGDIRLNGSQTTFDNGLAAGKTFTFSAYVNTPVAHSNFNTAQSSRQRRILFWYSTNGSQYIEAFGPQGENIAGTQRLSHTFTIPSNATGAIVGVGCMGSSVEPEFVNYIDNVLLEESSILEEYFDGGTASSLDFTPSWSGIPHKSLSILTGYVPTDALISINQVVAYRSYDSGGPAYKCIVKTPGAFGINFLGLQNAGPVTKTMTIMFTARASKTGLIAPRIYGKAGVPITLTTEWTTYRIALTPPANSSGFTGMYWITNGTEWPYNSVIESKDFMLVDGVYTSPGQFFDGETVDSGTTYNEWVGEPNNSISIQSKTRLTNLIVDGIQKPVREILPRTNLAYDPTGDGVKWLLETSAGGVFSASYGTDAVGTPESHYVRHTCTTKPATWGRVILKGDINGFKSMPITVGTLYTISAWVRSSRSEVWFGVQMKNTTVTVSESSYSIPVPLNTWTRITHTFVATAAYLNLYIGGNAAWVVGQYVDATAVLIEESGVLLDYFSGSTPPNVDYTVDWVGTPNETFSIASP